SMAPGAKFSTHTSAFRNKSLTSASPRSDFRFAVTDFLLALNSRKYQESCPGAPRKDLRPGSPRFGFSTLTTSAPSQASASVHAGPASHWGKSTTGTPERKSTRFTAFVQTPAERDHSAQWQSGGKSARNDRPPRPFPPDRTFPWASSIIIFAAWVCWHGGHGTVKREAARSRAR